MINSPTNPLRESSSSLPSLPELRWDRNPGARLGLLLALFLASFSVVAGKLVYLQLVQSDGFVGAVSPKLVESLESIPTTDGRILVGATVAARDVISYRLKMHYRWLEEPADEQWLRRRALSRLSGVERRDREKIAAAREQILAERRQSWDRLTAALGMAPDEFDQRRREIQQQVQETVRRVEDGLARRRSDLEAEERRQAQSSKQQSWWERRWTALNRELTTPPLRPRAEPVVIKEELSYHVIAENLAFEQVSDLIAYANLYAGVDFEVTTRREYPQGAFSAHLIGVRKAADTTELKPMETGSAPQVEQQVMGELQPGDRVGIDGLERYYDRWLKGRRGVRRIVRNADGEIITRDVIREPQPGADLELALSEPLQRRAEQLLDETIGSAPLLWTEGGVLVPNAVRQQTLDAAADAEGHHAQVPTGGCIVAMNVATGEILAAASAPRFDLRVLTDYQEDLWRHIADDPRKPMFPRVTAMALPPGSVFKTFTAIAALQEGTLDPNAPIDCIGYLDRPDKHRCYIYRHLGFGHGPTALTDALCRSCNVYFFQAAAQLGSRRLVTWSRRLGFGEPTGIDLPGEVAGNLPQLRNEELLQLASYTDGTGSNNNGLRNSITVGLHAKSASRADWTRSQTIEYGIGQSELTVTPLQIVRLMALVANGGDLVVPRLAREISANRSRSSAADVTLAQSRTVELSARTLHFVRQGLEQVVASPRGTGFGHVRLKEVAIAGKTGTAEIGGNRTDHAWFAGYVPADRPQVAFVVVLENGGSGAKAAGPLARELVREMLAQGLIAAAEAKE